jgi:hypothetical protein
VSTLGLAARAVGLGAAVGYFFDPDMGRRRRALVRDQVVRLIRIAREEVRAGVRDASNRAQGVTARVGHAATAASEGERRGSADVRGERRVARAAGLRPATRLALPILGAAALGRLRVPRHVRPGAALRLAFMGALGAAVATVERAQQRARAGSSRAALG